MTKLSVHLEDFDDDLAKVRRLRLQIGNKEVYTPRRSLNLKDNISESRVITNAIVRGINELYRILTKEKLDEISLNPDSQVAFGKTLNILSKPEYQNEINFLIFSYQNKNKKLGRLYNTIPSNEEVEKICEVILHPFSDMIIPPRISGITGEMYIEFLEVFFSRLKSHSYNKSIMGYLPFVARNELINLFDFYEDQGISSFIMDFDNNNPIDAYLTVGLIHRLTAQLEAQYGEKVYLHAFNVPFTRIKQRIPVTPAKDIITFMMGFDSFGTPHVPQKIPIEVVEKIKAKQMRNKFIPWSSGTTDIPSEVGPEVFRVFNRKDYGYYRSDIPNLDIQKEKNESISLDQVYVESRSIERRRALRKSFNVERQALEAFDLQRIISEDKVLSYLEEKKYAKDNFRMIARINKGDF